MSLVAFYKLDEDVNDYSGNNRDGTNNGVSFVSGQVNNAGRFNGSTDYVDLTSTIDTTLFETSFSVSLWFKLNSDTQGMIFEVNKANTVDQAIGAYYYDTNNTISFFVFGETVGLETSAISLDTWYHLVITWDGTTREIYLDNSLENSDTPGKTLTLDSALVTIGARDRNDTLFWDGLIDEIRIYDHVISSALRTRIYNWRGIHEIEIEGQDYSFDLVDFSGIKKFAQVTKFNLLMTDSDATTRNNILSRDDIIYKYQGTSVFRGFLSDVPTVKESGMLEIVVKGYEQRLLERYISVSYTSKTIDYIIKDIIDTYFPNTFTYNNVPTLTETYTIEYRGEAPWFIFNDLVKREDRQVFIDEDNDIHVSDLFSQTTGLLLDYDAGDAMYNPEFPDYGGSIFNSIIVFSKMKTPSGDGGVAVRYNNYDSIAEYGEVIEMPPKVVSTASTEEECFAVGKNIIDELAFQLQDGQFETSYTPSIFPGQLITLSLDSKNISNQQFIIKEVSHKIRPQKTFIEVAEVKSTTLKILKGVLQTLQSNEERHRDQSATISNQYLIVEEVPIKFTLQVDKQNNGARDWGEVAWGSFSWIANSNSWLSVISEVSMTLVNDGRTKIRDLIAGDDNVHFDASNAFIGLGKSTTAEALTQSALQNESDINADAGKTRAPMDAGYPLNPTSYKRQAQGTVDDPDVVSDTFYEAGLFEADSSGTMYTRKVISAGLNKNANEALRIKITLEVAEQT